VKFQKISGVLWTLTIEEHFRDTKSDRIGMSLEYANSKTHNQRYLLTIGIDGLV
jgi:hypothetical protein